MAGPTTTTDELYAEMRARGVDVDELVDQIYGPVDDEKTAQIE